MAIIRGGSGRALNQVGKNCVSEGTLVAGNSPFVIDVENTLAQDGQTINGNRGYVSNDSDTSTPAAFTVEIAHTADDFTTAFTLAQGEVFDLTGWDISEIRLTRVSTDCAFRVHVW
jgi:hypothetical protein